MYYKYSCRARKRTLNTPQNINRTSGYRNKFICFVVENPLIKNMSVKVVGVSFVFQPYPIICVLQRAIVFDVY